jgi:hypothetical protein
MLSIYGMPHGSIPFVFSGMDDPRKVGKQFGKRFERIHFRAVRSIGVFCFISAVVYGLSLVNRRIVIYEKISVVFF